MNQKDKIKRIAFAMERLYMINSNCLDYYTVKHRLSFNKGLLQPRTRGIFLDSLYIWTKIGLTTCIVVSLLRRNYAWQTYSKIFAGYFVANYPLPYFIFYISEMNRLRLLKKKARQYFKLENGNMNRVEFVLNPSTPLFKLRDFYL